MPERRRRRFRRRRLAVLAIYRKWRGYHHREALDRYPPDPESSPAKIMGAKLDSMAESFRNAWPGDELPSRSFADLVPRYEWPFADNSGDYVP